MIKCLSIKFGVFPFDLYPLQEGVHINYSLFTQIVVQFMNWELPWRTAVAPWIEDLITPVADWRVSTWEGKSDTSDIISNRFLHPSSKYSC